jgi:hypothetical protein
MRSESERFGVVFVLDGVEEGCVQDLEGIQKPDWVVPWFTEACGVRGMIGSKSFSCHWNPFIIIII